MKQHKEDTCNVSICVFWRDFLHDHIPVKGSGICVRYNEQNIFDIGMIIFKDYFKRFGSFVVMKLFSWRTKMYDLVQTEQFFLLYKIIGIICDK